MIPPTGKSDFNQCWWNWPHCHGRHGCPFAMSTYATLRYPSYQSIFIWALWRYLYRSQQEKQHIQHEAPRKIIIKSHYGTISIHFSKSPFFAPSRHDFFHRSCGSAPRRSPSTHGRGPAPWHHRRSKPRRRKWDALSMEHDKMKHLTCKKWDNHGISQIWNQLYNNYYNIL